MLRAFAFAVFLFFLQLASAQFQFFDGMFGQQQQRQQQQHHSGASQWAAHLESGWYIVLVHLTRDLVPFAV